MKKAIVFIIIIGLIELFFRLFYPQSQYAVTYAPWGWVHPPNTSVDFYTETPKFGWWQRKIKVKYNKHGLRGNDYDYMITKRLLIIGDSFIEDMGSWSGNLMTKYLERILLKENKWHYVINAGHYGYDDAQELMWYLNRGVQFSPDIVILAYANDTASKEWATMENGSLSLHYKQFSLLQKGYRTVASLIRRKTHFGSWLLTKVQNIQIVRKTLIDKGYKEKPIKIENYEHRSSEVFNEVDKEIFKRFREESKEFIILNVMGKFSPVNKEWLVSENFNILELDTSKISEANKDKKNYNPFYESHRFGYGGNKIVSQQIYEYLKEKGFL